MHAPQCDASAQVQLRAWVMLVYFYWVNLGALTRGTAGVGMAWIIGASEALSLGAALPLPAGFQLDWSAILTSHPGDFLRSALPIVFRCSPGQVLRTLSQVDAFRKIGFRSGAAAATTAAGAGADEDEGLNARDRAYIGVSADKLHASSGMAEGSASASAPADTVGTTPPVNPAGLLSIR